jgi:AP2 domain
MGDRPKRIGKSRPNCLGFRGISWDDRKRKFRSRIGYAGKTKLGYFDSAEEAARAYDEAAMRLYGSAACLNFNADGTRNAGPQSPMSDYSRPATGHSEPAEEPPSVTPFPSQRVTHSQHGYKGVDWDRRSQRWRAYIGSSRNGTLRRLGYFDKLEDAAQAYDIAAKDRYGDAAHLNFPLNGEKGLVMAREDRCPNGHLYSEELYTDPSGHKNCRHCNTDAARRYARRRAVALLGASRSPT